MADIEVGDVWRDTRDGEEVEILEPLADGGFRMRILIPSSDADTVAGVWVEGATVLGEPYEPEWVLASREVRNG